MDERSEWVAISTEWQEIVQTVESTATENFWLHSYTTDWTDLQICPEMRTEQRREQLRTAQNSSQQLRYIGQIGTL